MGKISLLKILSGKFVPDMEILNANKDVREKVGSPALLRGKNQIEIKEAFAGDIVSIAKLQHTSTGDTLCSTSDLIMYSGIDFVKPQLALSIKPKSKVMKKKSVRAPTFSEKKTIFLL